MYELKFGDGEKKVPFSCLFFPHTGLWNTFLYHKATSWSCLELYFLSQILGRRVFCPLELISNKCPASRQVISAVWIVHTKIWVVRTGHWLQAKFPLLGALLTSKLNCQDLCRELKRKTTLKQPGWKTDVVSVLSSLSSQASQTYFWFLETLLKIHAQKYIKQVWRII